MLDEHEGADAPAEADDDSVEEEAEDLDGEALDDYEGEERKGEEVEYEEYEDDEGDMEEYDEPPPDPPKKGGFKMDYMVIMIVMAAMTIPLLTNGGPRGPPRLGVFELDQVSAG